MFRRLAEQSGQGQRFEVDSAGTGNWHLGEQPDERMRRVAERHGWRYSGQARQVRPADLDAFDLIIAMDRENRSNLLSMEIAQQAKTAAAQFDPQGWPNSMPDPYHGGSDGRTVSIVNVDAGLW
jgi:protein-tyrosine phosphatase